MVLPACEARNCYLRALELDPGYPMVHNNLGWILQMQGDPGPAADWPEGWRAWRSGGLWSVADGKVGAIKECRLCNT